MTFGLSETTRATIRRILEQHPNVEKAVIYGSRAKGNYRNGSDIDLTLMGDALDHKTLSAIAGELDDSPIPHTVDLSLYAELNHAKLREHIDRVGVVFYERGGGGEASGLAGMRKGWQMRPLGELCDILDSQRKPITKRDRTAGEYPYYGATGIVDYVNDFIFDEPLVLVGEDGAKWESGENTAFTVDGKCWVNNHAHVLRPHRKTVIDNWLVHYLNHSDLTEFVSGLTVPKLNQGSLREIPIPVPPLPEQRRIVALLDEAFAGLATAQANAEKNLQNARALFDSHLQAVFTQRGEGWVEKKLGVVFEIGSSKRVFEREWTRSGVPFYGGREVVQLAQGGSAQADAYISEEKYRDIASVYGVPVEGDILMTARGTIGVGYVVTKDDRFYYKDGNLMCLHPKEQTEPRFVLYAFQTSSVKDQLANLTGATVTHLPIEKANSLVVAFPSFSIQQSVVKGLQQLEAETRRMAAICEQKLAALAALKKSLLHQAFAREL